MIATLLAATMTVTGGEPSADEALLKEATRYGVPPAQRDRKEKARAELMARGADGLRLVMRYAHLENIGVQEMAFRLVEHLDAREGAAVLVDFLQDEHAATRRLAVFLLGNGHTPEHAAAVLPLLQDEVARGAALRTLGRWKIREALPDFLAGLQDERETRRVVAANALRDLGDPAAIPGLLAALNDPYFTVREAAARALGSLGAPAEKALLQTLPRARDPACRHIIRTLGVLRSRRAVGALRRLLKAPDPFIRADAAEALALMFTASR